MVVCMWRGVAGTRYTPVVAMSQQLCQQMSLLWLKNPDVDSRLRLRPKVTAGERGSMSCGRCGADAQSPPVDERGTAVNKTEGRCCATMVNVVSGFHLGAQCARQLGGRALCEGRSLCLRADVEIEHHMSWCQNANAHESPHKSSQLQLLMWMHWNSDIARATIPREFPPQAIGMLQHVSEQGISGQSTERRTILGCTMSRPKANSGARDAYLQLLSLVSTLSHIWHVDAASLPEQMHVITRNEVGEGTPRHRL